MFSQIVWPGLKVKWEELKAAEKNNVTRADNLKAHTKNGRLTL